ncbi:hypothetical protein WISP_72479 [Willisornis vidua]|uniref:Uncharacterized protein n=1 Tax=Willisornis vidua TaxID=1566151 RepID=A0ABQ9DCE8_9PASS|nr:hypothetical protein WISP_72479 [Willisornis vidua]
MDQMDVLPVQRELKSLRKWTISDHLMKFKGKCQALSPRTINPTPQYKLCTAWLETSMAEKALVHTKLTGASNASLQQERINSTWGCIRRSTAIC